MVGEQLPAKAAEARGSSKSFKRQVNEITQPLICDRWYSPDRWRLVIAARDHLSEIVDQGNITDITMRAALLDELAFSPVSPETPTMCLETMTYEKRKESARSLA